MRRMTKAVLCILPGCLAAVGAYCLFGRGEWSRSRPDAATRIAVAKVAPNDVSAVVLDTPPDFLVLTPTGVAPTRVRQIQGFKQMYRVTKNPAAISLLLNGLREATTPTVTCQDKVFHITLFLKNGSVLGPFGFSQTIRVECFSPTFIEGLKAAGVKQIPRHPMPRMR